MNLKKFINKSYTQVSIYVIVVATIIMIIKSLIGNVPYFVDVILDRIGWVLNASKPIILALVFTYLLEPVVAFFEKQYGKMKILKNKAKRCRVLGVVSVMLIVLVAFTAVISILVFSITNQIKLARFEDIVAIINNYVDNINNTYQLVADKIGKANFESLEIKEYVQNAAIYILDWIKGVALGFLDSITGITSFVTDLIFAIVMTIYFLLDGKMIKYHVKRIMAAFMKVRTFEKTRNFFNEADQVFSGYIRGQGTDALCMAVLISITLSITGVKFAIIIGILAGIGNLIPYVGPIIAYVGTAFACIINGEFKTMIVALIALVVIQLVDGNIIGPKLLSNAVEVHPLLVIISLIFGSAIGGLLGMLLAVPVGALIKVLFMKYVDKRLEDKQHLLNADGGQ